MAINFPSNPTNGQQLQVGSAIYVYNSTKQYWRSTFTISSPTPQAEETPVFGSPNDLMLMGR